MVMYENIKIIESTIELYGNMQVIKRPYYTVVILINATLQFWYAVQHPKWRSK